jgi:signal transduction histidine kinase/DNA-binding response OmpR family regulator/HAMP domain-containing protein
MLSPNTQDQLPQPQAPHSTWPIAGSTDRVRWQRVGHKMMMGYGLALSLAIGGTMLGVMTGNRYQEQAWQRVRTAQLESSLIQRLQSETTQVQMRQYELLNDPESLNDRAPRALQLATREGDVATAWGDFQVFPINHQRMASKYGQQVRTELIKLNNQLVPRYFYELRLFVYNLKQAHQSADWTPAREQALVAEFLNSPAAQAFDRLNATLTHQAKLANQEVVLAQSEIRTVNQQSMALIAGSLAASTLLAALLGGWMSRVIGSSLGAVEKVAKSVIQTGDFSQRCQVKTQDEIGSLATSLNQLIHWVESHTQELETNRNQLAFMVAAQTEELRAIIDYLGDGLVVLDGATGQISRCNPMFTQMFGRKSDDVVGHLPQAVLGSDLVQLIQEHHRDPHPLSGEVALANGGIGQALISPILSESGGAALNLEGAVILVRDVTQDKQIDQMKTDFLSTVSHELRTPLTSVLGFAKLIQKKLEEVILPIVPLDERKMARSVQQVRDNLHIIISEGDRLTSLINDVLDIAKIEAGKVEWHMAPVSIAELVNQAVAATSVLAQTSNLHVVQEISPDLPSVLADRDRIVQVMINLLSNAIKFTEEGCVTCRVEQAGGTIVVRVIDTGMGLAPDDLELVFEKFKQVGEVMTNKPKGTGLGLPICKQIIEHHTGRIWAESTLGQGSAFCFTLPIVLSETTPHPILPTATYPIAQPAPDNVSPFNQLVQQLPRITNPDPAITDQEIKAKTILVVDDEPSIRQLLRQELESQNYQVKEAGNGIQALEVVRKTPPDLIILDVMMPKMNGLDLAAILKNNPETSMIPIIILSIMEEQARGYRLGVDRYQSKPINIGGLFSDVATLLEQGGSNHRILTVDGEVSTINALMSVLLERGYAPIAEWNGQTGIDVAMANQQHMVILDSGITGEPIAPHDPAIKTFRLDNGAGSIFFVLRSRSGVNLPALDVLPDLPSAAAIDATLADPVVRRE